MSRRTSSIATVSRFDFVPAIHETTRDDDILQSLAEVAEAEVSGAEFERAELLVADAIACILAGRDLVPSEPFAGDGAAGRVALLALRASSRDLDDVDWISLHHPGSVLIPIVLTLGRPDRAQSIVRSIVSGYRVAATMADLLGLGHRRRWHVTATAGAIGAASAASVLLGADRRQHAAALSLASANAGGIGQAALERAGAASFNRAAAASLGLLAARSAIASVAATREPLSGSRGLLALTSTGEADTAPVRQGILDAAPRVYPVTGFAQSAVLAAASLRQQVTDPLVSLEVIVTPIAELMCDGSAGGDWWNLRLAVARAWSRGDAFGIDDPKTDPDVLDLVSVSSAPLASGAAEVVATTAAGPFSSGVIDAPRLDLDSLMLLHCKWSQVLGQDPEDVMSMARQFVTNGTVDIDRLVG